jgi:multiple sugar transport system permease protein
VTTTTVEPAGGPPPGAAPAPRSRLSVRTLVRGAPLVPAIVLILMFVAGPIVFCVYYAFTDMQLTGTSSVNFVGFKNFTQAFSSSGFYTSVLNTLIFTFLSAIVGQNTLGLLLAVLIKRSAKVIRTITSTLVIAAWVAPEVVAGYMLYAFFRDQGSLDQVLSFLHLPTQDWLYTLPILAVSLANIWRGTAFSMMVYSAALSEVPQDLIEAAEVDGASPWQRFWHVTIPVIRRSIATNLMLITLQTLSVFGLIWAMTHGGPGLKATTLPIYTYQVALVDYQLGFGTAMALILLMIGAIFSLIYVRALRQETT